MKACIRGGNWTNSSDAGVSAMNLNNTRTNSNNNVGGRDCVSKPETTTVDTGNIGMCCPAKSEIKNEESLFSNLNVERQAKSKKTKRVGFLFEKAFTMQNLYLAFLDARKGKRKKRSTLKFEINLGAQLKALHEELHSQNYEPRDYIQFYVYEPKKRLISAPAFRDLVVQHAIYRVIYTIFDSSFIDTSYACRKGGGTHKASVYTQNEMRKYSGENYFVKMDIKKFFYSIDRDILRSMFEKKIKDVRFVDMMCKFSQMKEPAGIPIGNLLSQIYALTYMNAIDHFIKRELKAKSYVRYVDDFMVVGVSLEEAKHIKDACEKFAQEKLNLQYSHWHIQKIKRGINFVGYRTWKSIKFVRKHSIYKMKRAIKKLKIESIISLIGHAVSTGTMKYYKRLLIGADVFKLLPRRSQSCLLNM
ncbi:MAG: group II intron reverse transcriptase domain-containing protein [Campylobacterales bacterium]|nr:group II intron reverse transcriptase domain-containing protein [Campylobacterales bacterium]